MKDGCGSVPRIAALGKWIHLDNIERIHTKSPNNLTGPRQESTSKEYLKADYQQRKNSISTQPWFKFA